MKKVSRLQLNKLGIQGQQIILGFYGPCLFVFVKTEIPAQNGYSESGLCYKTCSEVKSLHNSKKKNELLKCYRCVVASVVPRLLVRRGLRSTVRVLSERVREIVRGSSDMSSETLNSSHVIPGARESES